MARSIMPSGGAGVLFRFIAGISFIAAVGCGSPPPQAQAPQEPEVVAGLPVVLPVVEWDEYVGRLDAVDYVEVRARVSGYLESTHFIEGQVVKAGDLLAVIDPRPLKAEVARSEAQVAEASAKVKQAESQVAQSTADLKANTVRLDLALIRSKRAQQLREKDAIPQEDADIRASEYAEAQANVAAAQARIESAKAELVSAHAAVEVSKTSLERATLELSYTRIVAPISGRISRRNITEGNLISGGSTESSLLTTIVSLDPIHCYFDADEQSFLKYMRLAQEGTRQTSRDVRNPVYFALADERNGFQRSGHMDFVENRLDTGTGTIRGRALLPNKDLTLVPGLFVRVRLPGSGRYEATLVPDYAVGTDQSDKFVYLVDEQNTINRQVIKLGPISNGLRIVREGLKGNERVVFKGLQRVRPGSRVKVKEEKVEPRPDGLPNEYQPVPEEQWLIPKRKPAANVSAPPANRGEGSK